MHTNESHTSDFEHTSVTNLCYLALYICQDNTPTWLNWHIKILIVQHDYRLALDWSLYNVQFYDTAQYRCTKDTFALITYNGQRYCDEILRPFMVPFNHCHHPMLQHDNALPHVARISTQWQKAENIQVFVLLPILAHTATKVERTNTPWHYNNKISSVRSRCDTHPQSLSVVSVPPKKTQSVTVVQS